MTGGSASPWSAGRLRGEQGAQLLFGVMYEDAALEEDVLAAAGRVFAIAGSGDTALRLGSLDRSVVAVDVNRAQVDYLRARLEGALRRAGKVDRLLAAARRLAPLAGWTPARVERFLLLSDVTVQRRVFDRVLATRRFRATVDAGLAPAALLRAYRPELVSFLPTSFGPVLRARLRRGIATHPNRGNPYARLLFSGEPPATRLPPRGSVEVRHGEAAAFLEQQPSGAFDGFALSNVLDGPDERFRSRLAEAIGRTGTPGAPVVLRTLREPADEPARSWATRDRSMIWGGIVVTTAAELPGRSGLT